MKNIKVFIIAPTFYPIHGGAGYRFYSYLPYLEENHVDVEVITGTPKLKKFTEEDKNENWHQKQNGELVDEYEIAGAKILKFKLPEKKSKVRKRILLDKAIQYCKNCTNKPDIIHVVSPMPPGLVSKLTELKKLGCKIILSYTIADNFPDNLIVRFIKKWKVWWVHKQYDFIIVPSLALKEFVLNINSDAKVEVISNGVDTKKFKPVIEIEKKKLREKLNLSTEASYLISVGGLFIHARVLICLWRCGVN